MLFLLGAVAFEVLPTNLDSTHRERGQDFAVKQVVGGIKPREAMGQSDSPTVLAGKLFPHRFGGGGIEALAAMAVSGAPQMLIRGDGEVYGWQCVEKVTEKHSYLDPNGVGRVIDFEVHLVASPMGAGAGAMMTLLQGLF